MREGHLYRQPELNSSASANARGAGSETRNLDELLLHFLISKSRLSQSPCYPNAGLCFDRSACRTRGHSYRVERSNPRCTPPDNRHGYSVGLCSGNRCTFPDMNRSGFEEHARLSADVLSQPQRYKQHMMGTRIQSLQAFRTTTSRNPKSVSD